MRMSRHGIEFRSIVGAVMFALLMGISVSFIGSFLVIPPWALTNFFAYWGTKLILGLAAGAGLILLKFLERYDSVESEKRHARIEQLEKQAELTEKVKPAWDLARAKLEDYFARNLEQVRSIYRIAVGAMTLGFLVILWGITISLGDSNKFRLSLIATASGIITEFIGVTFMAIYRATLAQANQYVAVLERINTVGMAVQILDSMDQDSPELKDVTRVDMIRLLLTPPGSRASNTHAHKSKSGTGSSTVAER